VTPSKAKKEDVAVVARKSMDFYFSNLIQVIVSTSHKFDDFVSVNEQQTVGDALQLFKKGLHRVAILSKDSKLVGVVTMTDLAKYFAANLSLLPGRKRLIRDLSISTFCGISSTATAMEAFTRMHSQYVSVLGIEENESLVGIISSSDLKGLKEFNFMKLFQPVTAFITDIRRDQSKPTSYVASISSDVTVETAVETLSTSKLHQLFVLDSNNKPIGVLSIVDILKEQFA